MLVVLMMAIAIVPAFAIHAAPAEETTPTVEEAIAGKQKLVPFKSPSDNVEDFLNIEIGAQINSFGCGFLDGNVYFDKVNAKTLMSKLSHDEVLTYVDGKLADMAPEHSRVHTSGLGGGYQLAIISAAFTSGKEATVTIVFGNTGYYTEFTVSPDAASLTYDDAEAIIRGAKATITVTGADVAAAYKVGDTVKTRLHDDHNDRTLTVTAVEGNKVVFSCDNFAATSKTILEIGYGTDKAISVLVDENKAGGVIPAPAEGTTFNVALQTKPGANAGNDMRFVISARLADLAAGMSDNASIVQNGVATLTFKKGDAVVKSFSKNVSDLPLYYEVVADGEYWTTEEGCALLGFIVRDVPAFAWTSFEVSIKNGDDVLYEGSSEKDIKETVAMGGYVWIDGEQNVTADSGNNPGYLFDRLANTKYEGGNGNTREITWNYDSAKTVTLYAISAAGDTANYGDRSANSWVLYGSTDGQEWVIIDDQTNPNLVKEGGQSSFYTVANPTAYQYYKINFVTQGGWFQIGEIKFFETAASVAYNFNDIIPSSKIVNKASNPAASYGHEGIDQLFDNNAGTKLGCYFNCNTVSITWNYDAPQYVTGYSITTANDSTRWNRNPETWTLYGSVDGKEWVTLDVASSALFSNELMIYGIDTPGEYQYFKLDFQCNNHAFQMADIALYN